MSKTNRICKVCGTQYYFCPNCGGAKATDKYQTMFCSKNCRDIFHTLSRYSVGSITKAEAKSILSELDLSKRSQFSAKIKEDLNAIMKTVKTKKQSKPAEVYGDETVIVSATIELDHEILVEDSIPAEQEWIINSVSTED